MATAAWPTWNRMAGRSNTCSYTEQNGYWLPERIKLHGTDLDVTLVIKDWQPRKLGQ